MDENNNVVYFEDHSQEMGDDTLSDQVIPEERELDVHRYRRQSSFTRLTNPMTLVWQNLSYRIKETKWSIEGLKVTRRSTTKNILKPQSGKVASGTLVAVIGPSGAGKSTLLQCLSGRKGRGVKGEVHFTRSNEGHKRRISVAFIPQQDNVIAALTIRESLAFASRLKNYENNCDHQQIVSEVIKSVNIESCADVIVSKCSAGQVKRLSIALELVSSPDVLVIDEPTTGLDSSTAFQCVRVLQKLAERGPNSPAIITSVHQPSAKLFDCFHQIYLLSTSGQCLYFGPPKKLTLHFTKVGLSCPSFYNPADFAIETASGDYGDKYVDRLRNILQVQNPVHVDAGLTIESVNRDMVNKDFPVLSHVWILLMRTTLNITRVPLFLWLRLLQHVVAGILLSNLWTYDIGAEDGCWVDSLEALNATSIDEVKSRLLSKVMTITDNTAFLFASSVFLVTFSLTSTVLTFPLELSVFMQERMNGWYQCGTYFKAKILSETPIHLLTTFCFCIIIYPITGQVLTVERFLTAFLFNTLIVMVSQSLGSFIGTIFIDDMMSAVFMAPVCGVPLFIFGGYFVRLSGMPWFLKPMGYLSYLKYAYEGILLSVYGFGRCSNRSGVNLFDVLDSQAADEFSDIAARIFGQLKNNGAIPAVIGVEPNCTEKIFNYTAEYFGLTPESAPTEATLEQPSYVLSFFEVNDSSLILNILAMIAFLATFRVVTYLLLLRKTNPKYL